MSGLSPDNAFPQNQNSMTSLGSESAKSLATLKDETANLLAGLPDVEDEEPVFTREVNLISLVFIAYFLVCGGAFGTEDLGSAVPPFWALFGLLLIPFTWSLPMSLITAELATTYPLSNAGFLGWTKRAWGDAISFLDGYIMTLVVMIDQALYPVIFVAYINNIEGVNADDAYLKFGYCVIFIGLSFTIAMLGVGNVGIASNIFGILTLAPFALFVIVGLAYGNPDPSVWLHMDSEEVDLPLYLSVLIWACCGYEYAGFLAADVKNPGRTFPIAMTIVVVLMMGTYILPISVGMATYPVELRTEITDGYYPILADHLGTGKWLGYMMMGGALLSNLGTYVSYLQTSATGLREMARDRKAPQIFRWLRTFKQPVIGMIFYSITTAILINFDFGTLVEMETMLYSLHIIVVSVSLVRLRWKDAHVERPFQIPGGKVGAIIVAALPVMTAIVHVSVFFASPEEDMPLAQKMYGFAVVAFGFVIFGIRELYRRYSFSDILHKIRHRKK